MIALKFHTHSLRTILRVKCITFDYKMSRRSIDQITTEFHDGGRKQPYIVYQLEDMKPVSSVVRLQSPFIAKRYNSAGFDLGDYCLYRGKSLRH